MEDIIKKKIKRGFTTLSNNMLGYLLDFIEVNMRILVPHDEDKEKHNGRAFLMVEPPNQLLKINKKMHYVYIKKFIKPYVEKTIHFFSGVVDWSKKLNEEGTSFLYGKIGSLHNYDFSNLLSWETLKNTLKIKSKKELYEYIHIHFLRKDKKGYQPFEFNSLIESEHGWWSYCWISGSCRVGDSCLAYCSGNKNIIPFILFVNGCCSDGYYQLNEPFHK
jgi:hypothetical protein